MGDGRPGGFPDGRSNAAARRGRALPRWAKRWMRAPRLSEQARLVVLAAVVGLLTGWGAVGFVLLLDRITGFARGPVAAVLGRLGLPALVLLPVLGGLLVGPLTHRMAREARGHGVPLVMMALARRGGRIVKRVAAVDVGAALLTIGFGGAAGRAGPIVQIGAAVGSGLARLARLGSGRARTLVASGAAAGVAATFNAPLAGAAFAWEVVAGRLRSDVLAVLAASVVAGAVVRGQLGSAPAFSLPVYDPPGVAELPFFLLLGGLLGWAASCHVRALYHTEDLFGAWRFPEDLKPAVGGLLTGMVLWWLPAVYGAEFAAVESALAGQLSGPRLAGLFAAAFLANCATLGSGGSGGVFGPALYLGAMLGGACGPLAHALLSASPAGPGFHALVGAAAFFAASAKAPLTSILLLLETTHDYRILPPVLAATAGSVWVSHRLSRFSIYSLKLHRAGVVAPGREESEPAAG